MARITYNYIKNFDISNLSDLNKKDTIELLSKFRKKFEIRERSLLRIKDKVYSPALDSMKRYYDQNGRTPLSKISRNKAQKELTRIRSFFQSRTSSESGAREYMREINESIFGIEQRVEFGKWRTVPKARLSVKEMSRFWSAFNEYKQMRPSAVTNYGYGTIQNALGAMILAGREDQFMSMSDVGKMVLDLDSIINHIANLVNSNDLEGFYEGDVYTEEWDDSDL